MIDKKDIKNIAIGGFDGMHFAHQQLFHHLNKYSAIIVIETDYANLTPKSYREDHTHLPIFYFKLSDIKDMDGLQFIKNLQIQFPNLEQIVVGYDFHFGTNRKYNIKDLEKYFDGKVKIIEEICLDKIPVHSRTIRKYLKNGDITFANKLLNKKYIISGTQISGQGLGTTNFVPTINIKCDKFLIPKDGVYATQTIIDGTSYISISFIGHRQTTDNIFSIETHIINHNIITKKDDQIKIIFLDKIRENKKFNNFEELSKQIKKDIIGVKNG